MIEESYCENRLRSPKRGNLDVLRAKLPVATLDELHKYTKWKTLLKGFFDSYGDRVRLIITGSSRIDIFRRGGDSLMGRYFLYHMHPWSVAESLSSYAVQTVHA
jgi:uncharacterized protein